jgi:23S rRNA (uracil1939-C5)-methyltransferase
MKMPKKRTTAQRRAMQAAKRNSAKSNQGRKHPARNEAGKVREKSATGAKARAGQGTPAARLKSCPDASGASGSSAGVKSQTAASISVEPQVVEIEKPVYGGAFLARLEGKAVFVPLVLPGEKARVRVTQSKAGYATAEAEEIVAAAPERIAPACQHFGACGGCQYQHTDYATQLTFKKAILRETLERGGVAVPVEIGALSGEPFGYRNRIRLAFDAAGEPGYRGRRSHAVVAVRECPIAAPLLVGAAQAFAEVLRDVAPALKTTEISLFCNPDGTALLASVFIAADAKLHFDELARAMHERVAALTGAELVVEGRAGEPSRTIARWGEDSLAYRAADFDYRVDHGAFFQVNRWLVDALVERVTAGHKGKLAWDLFAGVGLFARRLAAQFERVVAVESAPAATAALEANLRGAGGTAVNAETLKFLRGNRGKQPDLIVLDPPRTGLGAESCALLAEIAAPAVACVSCDPATLARDLRTLIGAGYAIESITLADLFPQTFHLETVVQLRRA